MTKVENADVWEEESWDLTGDRIRGPAVSSVGSITGEEHCVREENIVRQILYTTVKLIIVENPAWAGFILTQFWWKK